MKCLREISLFLKKRLNQRVLDSEILKEIENLFGVGDPSTGYINCGEAHGHSYNCVYFHNPATGIGNRLVDEIKRYATLIKDMCKETEESSKRSSHIYNFHRINIFYLF